MRLGEYLALDKVVATSGEVIHGVWVGAAPVAQVARDAGVVRGAGDALQDLITAQTAQRVVVAEGRLAVLPGGAEGGGIDIQSLAQQHGCHRAERFARPKVRPHLIGVAHGRAVWAQVLPSIAEAVAEYIKRGVGS